MTEKNKPLKAKAEEYEKLADAAVDPSRKKETKRPGADGTQLGPKKR